MKKDHNFGMKYWKIQGGNRDESVNNGSGGIHRIDIS